MPITPERLAARLEGPLAPVFLIAGKEALLVEEARDQVLEAARREGFTERDVLEASGRFDWAQLAEAGSAPSLFAQRRVLDLRIPTGRPGQDGAKALTRWAESPDPDTLLLITSGDWDGSISKAKWVSTLDKAGVVVGIWPVEPDKLPGWLAARMRSRGLQPDQEAVELMCERLEGNLLAAAQEVDRLRLLFGEGPVSAEQVEAAVSDSARFDAFRLLECTLQGQRGDALRVAAGLRATDTPLPMVLGAVHADLLKLHALVRAREQGVPESTAFQRLRIWPRIQGRYRAALARLRRRQVEEAIKLLSETDLQIKGRAAGEPWHTLERTVLMLTAGGEKR
ncbi:MAG: DNA polymerase III subunit delta [Xanthomonadales bacterium]|nr:DNA polymerase III subunit delta [Xanthomonadales bacterium]